MPEHVDPKSNEPGETTEADEETVHQLTEDELEQIAGGSRMDVLPGPN